MSELLPGAGAAPVRAAAGRVDGAARAIPLMHQPGRAGPTTPARTSSACCWPGPTRRPWPSVGRDGPRATRDVRHRFRRAGRRDRPAGLARTGAGPGGFKLVDPPDGEWTIAARVRRRDPADSCRAPTTCWRSGGCCSPAAAQRQPVLSPESVRQMMSTAGRGRAGQPVPGGPGLGLRRRGRPGAHRPVERARALRLGRWHWHRRLHRSRRAPRSYLADAGRVAGAGRLQRDGRVPDVRGHG